MKGVQWVSVVASYPSSQRGCEEDGHPQQEQWRWAAGERVHPDQQKLVGKFRDSHRTSHIVKWRSLTLLLLACPFILCHCLQDGMEPPLSSVLINVCGLGGGAGWKEKIPSASQQQSNKERFPSFGERTFGSTSHSDTLYYLPQQMARSMIIGVLQIHKTHVEWNQHAPMTPHKAVIE